MSKRTSWVEFLAGCLVGAALGSVTAFLLAPKTGRQVRDSISQEASRLAVRAYTAANPRKWNDLVAAEESRNLINNIGVIRSAGL